MYFGWEYEVLHRRLSQRHSSSSSSSDDEPLYTPCRTSESENEHLREGFWDDSNSMGIHRSNERGGRRMEVDMAMFSEFYHSVIVDRHRDSDDESEESSERSPPWWYWATARKHYNILRRRDELAGHPFEFEKRHRDQCKPWEKHRSGMSKKKRGSKKLSLRFTSNTYWYWEKKGKTAWVFIPWEVLEARYPVPYDVSFLNKPNSRYGQAHGGFMQNF